MTANPNRIVILTGAGISADSGVATFRDAGGLWERHRIEDVATPEAFARDPCRVLGFYNERRRQLDQVKPNQAHRALARLEENYPGDLLLVTQNVDDLHERAGSRNLIHMHGELRRCRCDHCGSLFPYDSDLEHTRPCPDCDATGALRPHVVWFGEMPLAMDRIQRALAGCDLFAAVGTSGNVYPAAGFVELARQAGAHTVEINLEPSEVNHAFHEHHHGRARDTVPPWVYGLLNPS